MESAMSVSGRPLFLEKLAKLYYGRLARCITLTGNIQDIFLLQGNGKVEFVDLERLLETALRNVRYPNADPDNCVRDKFIVLTLKSNKVVGVRDEFSPFFKKLDAKTIAKESVKTVSRANPDLKEAKEPEVSFEELGKIIKELGQDNLSIFDALKIIAKLLRAVSEARKLLKSKNSECYIPPLCIVIDQADMVLPSLDVSRMGIQDRETWMNFYDLLRDENIWADVETAAERPDLIILLSPTVAELNPKLFTLPKVEPVEIALPDETAIKTLAAERLSRFPVLNLYDGAPDAINQLSRDARGLTLCAVNDLITAAHRDPTNSPLNRRTVVLESEKRLLLELRGTVGLVRPEHTLKDIIGFKEHLLVLESIASLIENKETAPAGMTVVGPNGAGKTYMIEGWASQMGWTVLNFKGEMKSKWYGEQEIFLEKFEHTASVYGKVCIIVDEAHKAFGSIHKSETHEAEAQFTRHILQMISNPKYLSRIFWVLITTRPDMLDPDFVRTGRCSVFFPICDPEGSDVDDFVNWTVAALQKEGIVISREERDLLREKSRENGREFSAGDFMGLRKEFNIQRAYYQKKYRKELTLKEFLGVFKPSAVRIGPERKLQMLLAAKDCAWPQLLPASLRDKNETETQKEINGLKMQFAFDRY